jgi:hypothetical protein
MRRLTKVFSALVCAIICLISYRRPEWKLSNAQPFVTGSKQFSPGKNNLTVHSKLQLPNGHWINQNGTRKYTCAYKIIISPERDKKCFELAVCFMRLNEGRTGQVFTCPTTFLI